MEYDLRPWRDQILALTVLTMNISTSTGEERGAWGYSSWYDDPFESLRLVGYHPVLFPKEWKIYLSGLANAYSRWGVDDLVARAKLKRADGVGLFFLAYDRSGAVAGGIRFMGPLDVLRESDTLKEMSASREIDEIRDSMAAGLDSGVLEMKGMWASDKKDRNLEVGGALVRSQYIAKEWLGAKHVYTAAADRLIELGLKCGMDHWWKESVAFPSENYSSVAMHFASDTPKEMEGIVNYASGIGVECHRVLVIDENTRRGSRELLCINTMGHKGLVDQTDMMKEAASTLLREKVDLSERLIYIPWSGELIRALGPEAYNRIRLERNRNKITLHEQRRARSLRVGVIGASAGAAIAYALVLEGLVGELKIADFDSLELGNLNRVAAGIGDLGMNKATVVARRISELDPYTDVEVFESGVDPDNLDEFLSGLDVVIDECDSLEVKVLVRDRARSLGIIVIMETSDRGMLDVERFDIEPNRAILHGLMGEIQETDISKMDEMEKAALVVDLVGVEEASARAVASMLEIGSSLTGWTQLGSDVTLGAASVATAIRMLSQGETLASGRVRIDLEARVGEISEPIRKNQPNWGESRSDTEHLTKQLSVDPRILILEAARWAPSGGNVQPWRFEMGEDEVSIYTDSSKSHSSMDVATRGTIVAVGAAVMNARVRAARLGRLGGLELWPDGNASDLAARIKLGNTSDPQLGELNDAILTRMTNRSRGRGEPLADMTRERLIEAGEAEGVRVRVFDDIETKNQIARLIGLADRSRYMNTKIRREMLGEIRRAGEDLTTGLDERTLELGPAGGALLGMLGRDDALEWIASWGEGGGLGANSRSLIESASAAVLLSVKGGSNESYLRGGMGLERVWLSAETFGVALAPMAPVYLYATNEREIHELAGTSNGSDLLSQLTSFREVTGLGTDEYPIMLMRAFKGERGGIRSIRRELIDLVVSR